MSEHRRKSLRSFYCEEALWKALEQQSQEQDASMDQLLNDALRAFLEGASAGAPSASSPQAPVPAPAPPPAAPEAPPEAPPRPRADAELPSSGALRGGADHRTLERIPAVKPAGRAPTLTPPPPPAVKPPAPPPPSPSGAQPAVDASGKPRLFIQFDGQTYTVEKEKFIIGRGTQGTDLTIRDGNVSRKHAAVIFHTGNFYLQDMGSTNGIEFQGSRIDTKRVEDGDIFHICDHELRFSFQP